MSQSLYIASAEKFAGKSLISLGLIEQLLKHHKKVALYRPIIGDVEKNRINMANISKVLKQDWNYDHSYSYTFNQVEEILAQGKESEMLEKVVADYMRLLDQYDFVVCEGTGHHSSIASHELNLNILLAKNLGTPVLFIGSGKNRDDEQATLTTQVGVQAFKNQKVDVLGAILNLATPEQSLNLNLPFTGIITENSGVNTLDKIDIAHFANSINCQQLLGMINNAHQGGMTYKMFEYQILKMVKAVRKHIVLPEGDDDRVLKAADQLIKRNIVDITVLGDIGKMNARAKELGLDLSKARLIDPTKDALLETYAQAFYEMRKSKGVTAEQAKETMKDVSYFGTMMVKMKHVDGMVSGAAHSTGDTIRPGFQILKTIPGIPIVSSVFFMCLEGRVSLFGDCAVNPNPNAEQLAAIAISSADTAKAFNIPTKVAFHSYSTGDSGAGPDVDMVKEAVSIAKKQRPDIDFEGPIQYDASVNFEVAKKKLPGSKVAGHTRVHIFPDLNTGNTCYKAVQRESGAEAIGPMLQGLNGAVNDLSRGCSVLDIINTVFITAIQSRQFE